MQRLRASTIAAILLLSCKGPSPEEKSSPVVAKSAEPPAVPAPTPTAKGPAEVAKVADTAEQVALGNQLFFDKRLSVDGSLSCYSCHQNENGNGGATPLAVGPKGKKLTRHSPSLWDVGALSAFYWDGRSKTLEAQAEAAIAGGNMGVGKENLEKKTEELAKAGYQKLFEAAYPGEKVSIALVGKALAAYERTFVCDTAPYDRYMKGDEKALSEKQKEGLALFTGKALCAACHTPPHFTVAALGAPAFFNIGIGTKDVPEADVDAGHGAITKEASDWAAFKPPSLRNVSKSPPYFHDGSVKTLKEAVQLMAGGGIDNKNKSALIADKKLSDGEIDALVAFLTALDCGKTLEAPKLP